MARLNMVGYPKFQAPEELNTNAKNDEKERFYEDRQGRST